MVQRRSETYYKVEMRMKGKESRAESNGSILQVGTRAREEHIDWVWTGVGGNGVRTVF